MARTKGSVAAHTPRAAPGRTCIRLVAPIRTHRRRLDPSTVLAILSRVSVTQWQGAHIRRRPGEVPCLLDLPVMDAQKRSTAVSVLHTGVLFPTQNLALPSTRDICAPVPSTSLLFIQEDYFPCTSRVKSYRFPLSLLVRRSTAECTCARRARVRGNSRPESDRQCLSSESVRYLPVQQLHRSCHSVHDLRISIFWIMTRCCTYS